MQHLADGEEAAVLPLLLHEPISRLAQLLFVNLKQLHSREHSNAFLDFIVARYLANHGSPASMEVAFLPHLDVFLSLCEGL